MPRDVKTILKDDAKKPAAPGVEDDDILIDDSTETNTDGSGETEIKSQPVDDEAVKLRAELKKAQDRAAAEAVRADDAEKRANTETSKVRNAFEQQIAAKESEIDSRITTTKTNLDSIKQQLKAARAANDTDAEVDLQDLMTDARYALNAAEWEKKNFSTWKEEQKKRAEQPANTDDKSPYTAKERKWITSHPEFNTSKKFARLAKMAAQEARDEDIAQDSPAYFEYIENALKEGGFLQDDDDPTSGAGNNAKVSASTSAAPQKTGSTSPPVGKNQKYPFIQSGFRIPSEWVASAEEQGFEGKEGLMEYANMRLEEESKVNHR